MNTARLQTNSAVRNKREPPPSRLSRRPVRYAIGVTCSVIAAIIAVAIATDPLKLLQFLARPDRSAQAASTEEQRTGRIVLQIDPNQCRQMKFDNVTGQIGTTSAPCESVLDSRGMPVPLGTLHRLDAISKSFAHRGD